MSKKAKLLIGVLLGAILLSIGGVGAFTYAWLTDTGTDNVTYTMGDVEYTLAYTDLANTVVPGQNLMGDAGANIAITNASTVASDIRFTLLIEYAAAAAPSTFLALPAEWSIGTAATDEIVVILGTGWTLGADGYYTLNDVATTTTDVADFITSLMFNGALVGNSVSNNLYRFTFTFQAKQADYVEWGDLASYSFTTGLPTA